MTITILGQRIDGVTQEQALQAIISATQNRQKLKVATVNPEMLMAARGNSEFASILSQFNLCLPDGIGLLWAANLQARTFNQKPYILKLLTIWVIAFYYGFKTFLSVKFRTANLPQQVSGSTLSLELAKRMADQSLSLFLLGGYDGVAQAAANQLKKDIPILQISGTFEGDASEMGDTQSRQTLNQQPADIILVAYGAGKQEKWIARNMEQIPASVAIGVGGTLDFLAGRVRRAPHWVQRIGLEWLWRLILEPWRWRRQLALPKFIWTIVMDKAHQA